MSDNKTEDVNTKEFDVVGPHTAPSAEEEDIKIYEPKEKDGAVDDRHTRILDFEQHKARRKGADEPSPVMEGQLTFEGMEEDEPEESNEKSVEEQLQDARREKVENFRLIENEGLRLAGEEEESTAPSEEPEEGDVLEDYNSYVETAAVRGELMYRRRGARIGLLVGGFLEFLLLCLMLVSQSSDAGSEPFFFLGANLLLLIGVMLTSHRVIADGFGAVLRLRPVADTVTAIGAFATAIHTVLQFLTPVEVANGQVTLYCAVAGFSLLLAQCGRVYRLTRITQNFRMVSHKGDKYAAMYVAEGKGRDLLGRYLPTVGEPSIAYVKKSGFLTRFMEYSYDDEGTESMFCWFAPVAVAAALLVAMAHALLGGESANWWSAIGVFTAAVCAAAPAFAVAGANLPLCRAARALLRRGAMLIGWKAVDAFQNTDALLVDASEVFPSENILLHGIKTFSGARIDEAILDAAAVSIASGGPMAGVFLRVIENRTNMLQEVDTLLYEQDMGLSGWVGGRRVLVGNRRLLENHGVDVPSRDYEMRYTKDGRQLVYLSTGGDLCAMFVVSYTADSGVEDALHRLTAAGVTLLVRTCDPNVTSERICEVFHIDEEMVRILDTAAGRVRDALVLEEAERSEAVLACNGRLEGLGFALSFCRRLRGHIRATGVLQMIAGGISLLALAASVAVGQMLPPLFMIVNALIWAIITALSAGFLLEK